MIFDVLRGAVVVTLLVGLGAPASTIPVADKQSQAWFLGLPVAIDIQLPKSVGGRAPDSAPPGPVAKIYLTAPLDEAVAFTPDLTINTARGKALLPAHQDVLAFCAAGPQLIDTDGHFVLVGPRGDAATVRVRPLADPATSVSGGALATALKIGGAWVPLTSHAVIDHGVANGRLKLVRFMYGGRVRARGIDGALSCEGTAK